MIEIILSGLIFCFIITFFIIILPLNIDLYFLRFDINKHPVLKAIVDDVLNTIRKEEEIKVLHVSYEELNKNETCKQNMAIGKYFYTLDHEDAIKMRKLYIEVKELEEKHGKNYGELSKILDIDTEKICADDFYLPRILLCYDQLIKLSLNSYYGTYFHEIGHHFAAKEIGRHSEEDANAYGHRVILERLPLMFQLIPDFNFEYRLNDNFKLTKSQKRKALLEFLKYYLANRKTINKKNKNSL